MVPAQRAAQGASRTFTGGPENGTLRLAADFSGARIDAALRQVGGSGVVRVRGSIRCSGR
ncbi:MAG: hypothetical protein HYX34_00690 [Actinobacteria bacterium]|nr:hypothetical protein [Actinomycetota bacterium]